MRKMSCQGKKAWGDFPLAGRCHIGIQQSYHSLSAATSIWFDCWFHFLLFQFNLGLTWWWRSRWSMGKCYCSFLHTLTILMGCYFFIRLLDFKVNQHVFCFKHLNLKYVCVKSVKIKKSQMNLVCGQSKKHKNSMGFRIAPGATALAEVLRHHPVLQFLVTWWQGI